MNSSAVGTEFASRYFRWGLSQFEKEIRDSLSGLSTFECGPLWQLREFMRRLARQEQLVLARACVKTTAAATGLEMRLSSQESAIHRKFYAFWRLKEVYDLLQYYGESVELPEGFFQQGYPEATESLGENWLKDRKSLFSRLTTQFGALPLSREFVLEAERKAGKEIHFLRKAVLRTRIREAVIETFPRKTLLSASPIDGGELSFHTEISGWIVNTCFNFGRRQTELQYSHNIAYPGTNEHHGSRVAKLLVPYLMSFSSWLGITGETKWEYLLEDDLHAVTRAAMGFCKQFFEVAPELLAGLNPEKTTPETIA